MFDYSKLCGRIVEKFGTRKAFCVAAEVTESWLAARLGGKIQFRADEMHHIARLLDFPVDQIPVYFFTPKLR